MKRFLLSLVAIVITSVCFAQDIIVQKDGSTIQAKVLKVSQSEVEYKKFSNQNGPTYTISTRDLQCINYENGTKDTFVSPNYDPTIVTNETATQFSKDEMLLKMVTDEGKIGKRIKNTGWIVGGSLFAIGVIVAISSGTVEMGWEDWGWIGIPIAAVGIGTSTACYFIGQNKINKSRMSVQSSSIYQQEIQVGKNDRLMVGIDMLKDNTRRNQTLGIGVSYNF